MDKFFDCMNVRNKLEEVQTKKPFLAPYESKNDTRLQWLENKFLKYFEDWKTSVDNRPGKFTKNERAKMFLSQPTYDGLRITVYSTKELVPYLLDNGAEFVLTEKISQDDCEEHFGDHRSLGGRCDNPDLKTFAYQRQSLMVQDKVMCTSGNTSGKHDKKRVWDSVSDEPNSKKQRSKKKE